MSSDVVVPQRTGDVFREDVELLEDSAQQRLGVAVDHQNLPPRGGSDGAQHLQELCRKRRSVSHRGCELDFRTVPHKVNQRRHRQDVEKGQGGQDDK